MSVSILRVSRLMEHRSAPQKPSRPAQIIHLPTETGRARSHSELNQVFTRLGVQPMTRRLYIWKARLGELPAVEQRVAIACLGSFWVCDQARIQLIAYLTNPDDPFNHHNWRVRPVSRGFRPHWRYAVVRAQPVPTASV